MANEKRLIDANVALLNTYNQPYWTESESAAMRCFLVEQPTVDAAPVVHGRWIWDVETHGDPMYGVDEDFGYRCSECQVWADEYGVDGDIYEEPPTHILHYCPNCGADMRGNTE